MRSNLLISQSATATASALLSSVASTIISGTSAMNACPAMVSARSYSRISSSAKTIRPATLSFTRRTSGCSAHWRLMT